MFGLADTRCKKCQSYFDPLFIPSFLAEPYKNRAAKEERLQQQKPKAQEFDISSQNEEPPEPEDDPDELRSRLEKCQGIIHYLEKAGLPQDPALQKEAADIQKKLAQPKAADPEEEPSEKIWFKEISKLNKKIAQEQTKHQKIKEKQEELRRSLEDAQVEKETVEESIEKLQKEKLEASAKMHQATAKDAKGAADYQSIEDTGTSGQPPERPADAEEKGERDRQIVEKDIEIAALREELAAAKATRPTPERKKPGEDEDEDEEEEEDDDMPQTAEEAAAAAKSRPLEQRAKSPKSKKQKGSGQK